MPGILHIFRLGEQRDEHRETIPEYQVSYSVGEGNSYARTFTGRESLSEFLAGKALIPESSLGDALRELDTRGHLTITDVEIPEHETAAIGLEELPSDF
jgi:hypothetical protein